MAKLSQYVYNKVESLPLIDNYIYISTLGDSGEFLILPTYPDTITDSMTSTFAETNALSRSAPVLSYSYSGPRTVQINLELHRDMLEGVNTDVSNMKVELGDDYVDTLIKKLQSISVPKYNSASKEIQPPWIAIRFGDTIFIKGIVNGTLSVSYKKPILSNNKYAMADISFNVTEIDPYDAPTIAAEGSFRGLTAAFKDGLYIKEN